MNSIPLPARIEVPDAVPRRWGFQPGQRKALRAIAETLFTSDAGPPDAARLDWLCDDLEDFLGRAGRRARGLLSLCTSAITWLAPLYVRRMGPFHALEASCRAAALERMERSALGLAVFGAKTLLCIVWYEHPATARSVGYDGRCLR